MDSLSVSFTASLLIDNRKFLRVDVFSRFIWSIISFGLKFRIIFFRKTITDGLLPVAQVNISSLIKTSSSDHYVCNCVRITIRWRSAVFKISFFSLIALYSRSSHAIELIAIKRILYHCRQQSLESWLSIFSMFRKNKWIQRRKKYGFFL